MHPSHLSPLLSRDFIANPPNPANRAILTAHHLRSAARTLVYCSGACLVLLTLLFLPILYIQAPFPLPSSHLPHPFHRALLSHDDHLSVMFAAIGDWGRHGNDNQRTVSRALENALPSDLTCVISVGDNFYPNGVRSVRDPHFNLSFEAVYAGPRIHPVPWLVALGNHDYRGSVRAQLLYSTVSPRWIMPARYFSRWLSPALLAVFLDTTPLADARRRPRPPDPPAFDIRARQLAWLRDVLASAPPTARLLIVGHHNMYSPSIVGHLGVRRVRHAVEPILRPYANRIVAYLCGHEHYLAHMQPSRWRYGGKANPVDHFITGAGSKLRPVVQVPDGEADYWTECCGVLPHSTNVSVARTAWSASENGFLTFRIQGVFFTATAFNCSGHVIYQYTKVLPSLE